MTNPSFNFQWDGKQKKVSAKVFSRRRPQKNANSKNVNKHTDVVKNDAPDNVSLEDSEVVDNTRFEEESSGLQHNVNDSGSANQKREFKSKRQQRSEVVNTQFEEEPSGLQHDNVNESGSSNQKREYKGKRRQWSEVETHGKAVTEKLFASNKSFGDLQVHKHIVSNLEKNNFMRLTAVQEKAIPVINDGKNTLVRSQTGSGKTLAYAVPILNTLVNITPRLKRQDGVQALIVVPTRELALQTHEIFSKINTFQWIVTGHLCGGENRKTEKDRLRKGVHLLIGTPGRLLDHILHTAAFNTGGIRYLVLDEADRLLDMGFRKDIIRLVEEIDNSKVNSQYDPLALLKSNSQQNESDPQPADTKTPTPRQTLLLSATLTKGVIELAEFAMKDHIFVDALDSSVESNSNSFVIPDTVQQQYLITRVKERLFTLSALLISMCKRNSKVFVFMASGHMVDFHYQLFTECLLKMPKSRGKLKSGDVVILDEGGEDEDSEGEEVVLDMPIFKLHGSMDQQQRKEVFQGFRACQKGVLLCTDVVARGIDVPTADCIIQYTGPQTDEDYLHRVGRTGRAGKSGLAIIFLTIEEKDYIQRLQEHQLFLKRCDPRNYLNDLCELMEQSDPRLASFALQKRYENAVAHDKTMHKTACLAYSTWARFYNSYPAAMREIFSTKKVNMGHYVSSFAIRDPPSRVSKVVRGQVKSIEKPHFNRKLANHEADEEQTMKSKPKKRKNVSLTVSEYGSGLEPTKKKKKKTAQAGEGDN